MIPVRIECVGIARYHYSQVHQSRVQLYSSRGGKNIHNIQIESEEGRRKQSKTSTCWFGFTAR